MKILFILLIIFSITCTKEYSDKRESNSIDTPKNYFVNYDILIDSLNNSISHIEAQVKRKPEPFFWTYEIFNHVDDTISFRYMKTFDVTWLLENNEVGDTAVFGYVIIYPGPVVSDVIIIDTILK